jgi:hypothetical protein
MTTRGLTERQASDAVLMVRPRSFGANPQTATSNFFQRTSSDPPDVARALREFDALALALASSGIRVHQFAGERGAALPDEIFPNNWLSLHADGTAVLYPLLATNRRAERRREILDRLVDDGYRIERIIDLTPLEAGGAFLEGTGSLVLDRPQRMAYACRSPRTHDRALAEFVRLLDYEAVAFDAVDRAGRPIYHTNVLMSVGTGFAALCTSAIRDREQRELVRATLERSGHELVDLSYDELDAFAGNLLELASSAGPVIALSATALAALEDATRRALERHGSLVATDIATIEGVGGGSVRCMLAEVALPRVSRGSGETSRPRSPRN